MSYTLEFPNMAATGRKKDGESISKGELLLQETYENQGWSFNYNESGFWKYHWEVSGELPYIIYISESLEFPNMNATGREKDGGNISGEKAIEAETYANWDFDEVWELPKSGGGTFYLPNLQGAELAIWESAPAVLRQDIINVIAKFKDIILSEEQIIVSEPGLITIIAPNFKRYDVIGDKTTTIKSLGEGKEIDIIFEYGIAPPKLLINNEILTLQIVFINTKRDRYKIQRRLLSGQYVTQTIDKGRNIYNIKFYATAEQKQKIDELYSIAEEIELIRNLKITKLKIKNLNWNVFIGGNYEERVYVGQIEATEARK